MSLELGRMMRREILEAAEVATRAFDDYEYSGKTMGSWSVRKKLTDKL